MAENLLWELTKLPRHMGGSAGAALYLLGLIVLGILAPLYLGYALIEVRVLLLYAALPLLLTPPVMAESVAGERELKPEGARQRMQWINGKIGAGVIYGWASAIIVLVLLFAALRLSLGHFADIPPLFLAGLLLVSLAWSLFAASLSAAVAMSARSAKAAKRIMRQGLLLLLIILLFVSRQPWAWTGRFAVPETGPAFLELAVVIAVVLGSFSVGLARLALHAAEATEIHLDL